MAFTFQVHQNRNYLKSEGIGRASAMVGEFPATLHGLRKAFACAKDNTYGQEPGRIAPSARCFVVAAKDGQPVKLKGHEAYDDQDNWLDYYLVTQDEIDTDFSRDPWGNRTTKTALFSQIVKSLEKHAP